MTLHLAFLATALAGDPGQWVVGGPLEPWFGLSVALSGDTLVVGNAPGSQGGPWAFVYEERGGEWVRTATLGPEQGPRSQGGQLQVKVEVSGDLLALYSWTFPERVLLYAREGRGWTRVPFEAPQAVDVDVDQGRVAVVDGGSVQLFTVEGGRAEATEQVVLDRGPWSLTPHDVVLEGDRLVVGMPQMASGTTIGGKVSVFRRSRRGWEAEATVSHPQPHVGFGHGVALSGRDVVASVPFGFDPDQPGRRIGHLRWLHRDDPLPVGDDAMASTAESLDANARYVVTGLHVPDETALHGAMAVLRRGPDGDAVCVRHERDQMHFGFSVALDGERVAVGSPTMNESRPGRVWVGPVCAGGEWRAVP